MARAREQFDFISHDQQTAFTLSRGAVCAPWFTLHCIRDIPNLKCHYINDPVDVKASN